VYSADGTAAWGSVPTHTHSDYVPTSRTINSKALTGNITLTASDVGASASDHNHDTKYQYWVKKTIDLSNTTTYADTTWFPVTGTTLQGGDMRRILVDVELNSGTKPSWSTHNGGFSVILDMFAIGSGWGTTSAASVCLQQSAAWTSDNSKPPASFSQMNNSSTPVLWLRGGGKYFVWTNYACDWTPRTSTYTVSEQSVTPTTTYPALSFTRSTIWANLNGTASSASVATKLGTTTVGGTTTPIYLNNGAPTALGYTIAKSVPSDAVFTDTVYTHPTTSGNKHIPSGGSSGQFLKWSADGTATWAADNNTLNTAGSTDTSSKIFLVGATSQAANPQTYSHDTVFVDTDGALNSATPTAGNNSTKVATTAYVTTAVGNYLPKSGGTMTGALNFANNTWNNVGDDAAIGDCNVGGHIGVKQLNGSSCGFQFYNSSGTALSQLNANSSNITSSGSLGINNNAAKMQYNSTTEAIEFVFA
jgi:hypothetical protein